MNLQKTSQSCADNQYCSDLIAQSFPLFPKRAQQMFFSCFTGGIPMPGAAIICALRRCHERRDRALPQFAQTGLSVSHRNLKSSPVFHQLHFFSSKMNVNVSICWRPVGFFLQGHECIGIFPTPAQILACYEAEEGLFYISSIFPAFRGAVV